MGPVAMGRLVGVLAVALLVGACGGAGGAGTAEGEPAGTDDGAASANGEGSVYFGDCNDGLLRFSAEVELPYAEAVGATAASGPVDYETVLDELDGFVEAAPADIREDFQAYADEVGPFLEGLAQIDYDPDGARSDEQVERFGELADEVDSDVVRQSADTIRAWFGGDCRTG